MFEHRTHPLLPARAFALRLAKSGGTALLVTALSLALGALGYHATADCSWVVAVHAAAMILTGMGPALEMESDAARLFETVYALFSGIVFLFIAALLLAPIGHRILHHFHLEETEREP